MMYQNQKMSISTRFKHLEKFSLLHGLYKIVKVGSSDLTFPLIGKWDDPENVVKSHLPKKSSTLFEP